MVLCFCQFNLIFIILDKCLRTCIFGVRNSLVFSVSVFLQSTIKIFCSKKNKKRKWITKKRVRMFNTWTHPYILTFTHTYTSLTIIITFLGSVYPPLTIVFSLHDSWYILRGSFFFTVRNLSHFKYFRN